MRVMGMRWNFKSIISSKIATYKVGSRRGISEAGGVKGFLLADARAARCDDV